MGGEPYLLINGGSAFLTGPPSLELFVLKNESIGLVRVAYQVKTLARRWEFDPQNPYKSGRKE